MLINFFINRLRNKDYIRFVKLNHSYWQLRLKRDPWHNIAMQVHGADFVNELHDIVSVLPENFTIAAGFTPDKNPLLLSNEAKRVLPQKTFLNGRIWKDYVQDKQIYSFIEEVRKMRVVVGGFKHLEQLKDIWKIRDFHFYEMTLEHTTFQRQKVLQDLSALIKDDSVVILQAGEWLSLWLIYHLCSMNAHLIDMGRSLDIWTDYKLAEDNKIVDKLIPDWKHQYWDSRLDRQKLRLELWEHLRGKVPLL